VMTLKCPNSVRARHHICEDPGKMCKQTTRQDWAKRHAYCFPHSLPPCQGATSPIGDGCQRNMGVIFSAKEFRFLLATCLVSRLSGKIERSFVPSKRADPQPHRENKP
jgi:hypothetical protein